jgi:hypothetical protein
VADGEFLHTNLLYRLLDRLLLWVDVLLAQQLSHLLTLLGDPGTLVIMLLGIGLCCAIFAWACGTLFLHLNRTRRRPGPGRAARRAAVPAARPTRRRRQGQAGAPRSLSR